MCFFLLDVYVSICVLKYVSSYFRSICFLALDVYIFVLILDTYVFLLMLDIYMCPRTSGGYVSSYVTYINICVLVLEVDLILAYI